MRSRHGHTPAAWISVAILIVGSVIAAFGVGAGWLWLSLVGAAVFLAGIVVAKLLQRTGHGQYPPQRARRYDTAEAYLGAQRDEDPASRRPDVDQDAPAAS